MVARRQALFAVALVAALLLVVSTAGASSPTTIIVSLKFPAFHGSLKSPKGACAKHRQVKLFRERSGPDKLLGTDKSNAKAEWSIPLGKRLSSGAYYAKVAAKGSCRAAKSNVIPID
ncbi:MAG TPA: hypothetical protein VF085_03730 [Solirubrobacterales bacterium]